MNKLGDNCVHVIRDLHNIHIRLDLVKKKQFQKCLILKRNFNMLSMV